MAPAAQRAAARFLWQSARRIAASSRRASPLVVTNCEERSDFLWAARALGGAAAAFVAGGAVSRSQCDTTGHRLYPKDLEQFLKPSEFNPIPVTMPPPFPGLARILCMIQLTRRLPASGGHPAAILVQNSWRCRLTPPICSESQFKALVCRGQEIIRQFACLSILVESIPYSIMKVTVDIHFATDSKATWPAALLLLLAPADFPRSTGPADSGQQDGNRKLSLVAKPSDTVQRLKQRVTLVEPVPFPEQDLQLDGASLKDEQRLGDLNLREGQVLNLTVRASETAFTDQLAQLLKARPLSAVELGLLYTHKFGATVKTALNILGCPEPLSDFLLRKKRFAIDPSGFVSLSECQEPVQAKATAPLPENVEIKGIVTVTSTLGNVMEAQHQLRAKTTHTAPNPECTGVRHAGMPGRCAEVQSLCDRALASELVPFEARDEKLPGRSRTHHAIQILAVLQATKMTFQGQDLEGRQQLGFYKMAAGGELKVHVEVSKELLCHQLAGLLQDRCLSFAELGDLYCYRYGAPIRRGLELLGLQCTLKLFVASAPEYFHVETGCIAMRGTVPARSATGDLNQRYLQLDAQISTCKLVKDAAAALEQVCQSARGSPLSVGRTMFLGSVGRGTAIEGSVDAQALLLIKGKPATDRQKWLPPLLPLLAAALSQDLGEKARVSVTDESVHVHIAGVSVEVVVDAVGGPLALAADRSARLFDKLPTAVKVTMRLMKWWRNQQPWSSDEERPSDLLLEHIVASTTSPAPVDQVAESQGSCTSAEALFAGFIANSVANPSLSKGLA
ncbi:benK [Symbiodinium sp. CCMP2592]|nr:benK [Symbiodinium sp. CCMP2592]